MPTSTMALGQSIRSFDKVMEESQLTGELRLGGRALKELPSIAAKYSIRDILVADISKNRLLEIPNELIEYGQSLEELDLYHNSVRNVPDSIHKLRSLTYLNLSRNQLTFLPSALCLLPLLEVLIVAYNKLVSLPEEIGQLSRLTELDVRCNEISQLPVTLKRLESLVSLSLRRNSLQRLPEDIHCLMSLRVMDMAENQVTSLPLQMRLMSSLEQLDVTCNPLVFPPAHVCARGRQHIYKYLEMKAVRGEQEERLRRGASDELELRAARPVPVGGNDTLPGRGSAAVVRPADQAESRASVAGAQRGSHAPPEGGAFSGHDSARDSGHVQLRRFEPARSASGLHHTGRAYGHPPSAAAAAPPVGTVGNYSSQVGHQSAPSAAEQEWSRRDRGSIERLRQNIEDRLHVSLPDDLRSALGDGVVLCHLANHVRPRAVSSIHVPSPAVPKLNEAKCRRNLHNFLEACRRIGVEEEYLCAASDVCQPQTLGRVSATVDRLLRFATAPPSQLQSNV